MLKDAQMFLERQRAALETPARRHLRARPDERRRRPCRGGLQLDKALEKLPWLQPVCAQMFVGKYDPARLRFADKLVTKLPASPLHGLGPHDDRDWDAIGAWADELT